MTILSRFPAHLGLPRFWVVVFLGLACSQAPGKPGVDAGQSGSGGVSGTAGGGTGGPAGAGASGGTTADAGPQMDGAIDASNDADAGPPPAVGRVLVVQQSGSSAADLWTRAWFARASACPNTPVGYPGCSCTDGTIGGCVSRSCTGRGGYYFVKSPLLLGYAPADALETTYVALDAGMLEVRNGSLAFEHPFPYDVHDTLASPWQSGDAVRVSASGATVPAFSIDVPFPPRVSFLQPDFSSGTVVLDSDTLDVRWTPVDTPGTVEVMVSSGFQPDAAFGFTVVRCSAPVGQGQMQVPVVGRGVQPSMASWLSLAIRVINRGTVQVAGLTVDAIVASYDSGPINEAPSSSDSGAAD